MQDYKELVELATQLSQAKQLSEEATSGYAGTALKSRNGKIYSGKSLTGICSIAFCGEVNAVLDMLKDGASEIKAVVTVSNDHKLMPPCGRCREMMYQVSRKNLNTKLILEGDRVLTLKELFPERAQELWEDIGAASS
jgi:cytidine deaminase